MSVRSLPRLLFGIAILSALIVSTGVANASCSTVSSTVTCLGSSNGTSVFSTNGGQESGPEPTVLSAAATISVTGGSGTVSGVTVTLVGYNDNAGSANDGSGDMGLVLVSPSGRKFEIMRSVGSPGADPSTITFTIADGGTPFPNANCACTLVPLAGGTTYSPSAYDDSGFALEKDPNYSSAGLSGTILDAATNGGPVGSAPTFASVFGGDTVNGTWTLYLAADPNGFIADITFSSWDISVTFTAASTPSTTTLSSSSPVTGFPNTAFTSGSGSSVTLTATVTSGATGTVTFKDGGSSISCSGGNPATLSSGHATCVTTFSTEGLHSLSAGYSGDGTFEASSGNAGVFAMNHSPNGTGANATKYCNTGGITGDGESQTDQNKPYPSVIFIGDGVNTDITSSVNTVSVILNNFQGVNSNVLHMLLVAPDGTHSLDFWSNAGSNLTTGTYTLIDGSTQLPATGSFSPGSYGPTTYGSGQTPNTDLFTPAPAAPAPQIPGTYSVAFPVGSATFTSSFVGANAHGPWALFLYNGSGIGDTTTLSGGWCLDVSPGTGHSTSTSVTPSATFNTKGTLVTFTATITSSPTPNVGTVTFTENGSPLVGAPNSGVSPVSSGVATTSTTSLPEGDHTITATYQDSTDTFNESFSTASVRVDAATATPTLSSNTWSYCNTSGITIPFGVVTADDIGPAAPNPSNIFVTNLYGTIDTVTLTLDNFKVSDPNDLDSLLVGPNGSNAPTSAQTLDFFSQTPSGTAYGAANTTFSDSGSLITGAPTSLDAPTSDGTNATDFFASKFYVLPTPFQFAAPHGSSTFGNVYSNSNPNGTWSLYFNQLIHNATPPLDGASAWCMNFTENAPSVGAVKSHTGPNPNNHFGQGGTGSFSIVVTNNGPGSTGDPDGNHPLIVTDTLAADFTPGTPTGTDWSCLVVSQTVTCKNHDAIAQASSYPTLTIPVTVSATAGATDNNSASISGGGANSTNSNTDTVTIDPAPVLTISKSPNGTFTQGQTAEWDLTVGNTAPNGSTAGTTTVVDTLPTNYTLSSSSGTLWGCSGTTTVTCTSSQAVTGGSLFNLLKLIVNVPAASATSITNNAVAFGGGDLNHTNSGNAATTFSTVSVVQVPASVTITAGGTQSAPINTAFGTALTVVVKDAGGRVIPSQSVTFTAPSSGPSGTFSNSSNTITASTNSSGQLSETFTANGTAGGPYSVTATAGSVSASPAFTLTNNPGPPFNIAVSSGSGQNTTTGTAFQYQLVALVTDSGGNPVPNASVTFAGPATGAGATFTTSPATTNSSGLASVTATANGNAGSYTVKATVTGTSVTTSPSGFSLTNNASTVQITLATSPTGLMVSANGGTSYQAAPYTFAATIGSPYTIVTQSPQGIGTQYTFTGWSDSGAISHVITPTTAGTYTASFSTAYLLTVNVSPSGSGTATPTSGTYYAPSTIVNLGATANTGYVFSSWTGPVASSSSASTTVTMSGPETVTANFNGGPTSLGGGTIGAKSGPQSARVWRINIGNNGPGVALGAELTNLVLTQTSGAPCAPTITSSLPAVAGTIAPHASAVADVTINFSGCPTNALFKAAETMSANSGTASGSVTELNQLQ